MDSSQVASETSSYFGKFVRQKISLEMSLNCFRFVNFAKPEACEE